MDKRAMNMTAAGMLAGALGGAALAYANGDLGTDGGLATVAVGAAAGGGAGSYAENVASWVRGRRLKRLIGEYRDATSRQLHALRQEMRRQGVGVPIYTQAGGRPLDNAMYVESLVSPPGEWVNQETGRRVSSPASRAIYVGTRYNKLPILAHEAGHAIDFKKKRLGEKLLATGFGAAHLLGVGLGAYGLLSDDENGWHTSLAGGLLALAGLAGGKFMQRKWERTASDNAMKLLAGIGESRKKQQAAADLLQAAYNTYEPIQLSGTVFEPLRPAPAPA